MEGIAALAYNKPTAFAVRMALIGHLGCATSVVSSPSVVDLLLDEKQCTLGVDTKD